MGLLLVSTGTGLFDQKMIPEQTISIDPPSGVDAYLTVSDHKTN